MSRKPPVRTLMESQLVEGPERLLRSAPQDFCHVFSSFRKEITSKTSVLVVSEILRPSVTILTADEKYSVSVKGSF